MAQVTINAVDYDAYIGEVEAGEYLAADLKRAPIWSAGDADDQRRALITASRIIAGQQWEAGAPAYDLSDVTAEQGAAIEGATAMLAADLLDDPDLASALGGKRETKRVKAGTAEVEFFNQGTRDILPLPRSIWSLLAGTDLIGSGTNAAHGESYYGGAGLNSRLPEQDQDWPDGIGGGS